MPELNKFVLPGTENLGEDQKSSPSSIVNPINNKPITNIPEQHTVVSDLHEAATQATTVHKEDDTKQSVQEQLINNKGVYLAVVNNDQEDDYALNPWGTLGVKRSGLANGTVVLVDSTFANQIHVNYTPESEMTADYLAKINDFKSKEQVSKAKFERSSKLQEMAKKVEEEYIAPENKTTFLDILVDAAHDTLGTWKNWATGGDPSIFKCEDQVHGTMERFIYESAIYHDVMYRHAHEYVKDYIVDPDAAIAKLLSDDTITDREREYYAYEMVTSEVLKNEDIIKSSTLNLLRNLGEAGDWLANPVKASVMWIDAQNGKTWTTQNDKYNLQDKSFLDTLGSCYRASWQNEGRAQYDYDTGFMPFDMVLEFLSDPEGLLKIGKVALERGTLTKIANDIGMDKHIFKNATARTLLRTGDYEGLIKQVPEWWQGAARAMLGDMSEYSKYLDAEKTLGKLLDIKQFVDDKLIGAMFQPLGLAWKMCVKAGEFTKDIINLSRARAFAATFHELASKYQTNELTIDFAQEFMDKMNIKIAAEKLLNDPELGTAAFLSKDEVYEVIKQTYLNSRITMENANVIAIDLLRRNELTDTQLYHALTVSYDELKNARISLASSNVPDDIAFNHKALRDIIDDKKIQAAVADTTVARGDIEKTMLSYKIESSLVADTLLDNKALMSLFETMSIPGETSQAILARIQHYNSSMLGDAEGRALKEILKYRSGVKNYKYISEVLASESANFTKEEQKWMKDYLFNEGFQRKVKYSSPNILDMDDDMIRMESRSLANDLVKGSFHIDDIYTGSKSVNFEYLGDTYDFGVLKKIGKERLTESPTSRYVYYTTRWDDVLDTVTLEFDDGTKFVLNRSTESIDSCNALDTYIRELETNGRFTLVGFNTHASGYDTDSIVRTICSKNHSIARNNFINTIDLADMIRQEQGLPIITQSQLAEMEEVIYTCMKNTQDDNLGTTGILTSWFRLVPPNEDEMKQISNIISNSKNYRIVQHVSDDAIASRDYTNAYFKMREWQKTEWAGIKKDIEAWRNLNADNKKAFEQLHGTFEEQQAAKTKAWEEVKKDIANYKDARARYRTARDFVDALVQDEYKAMSRAVDNFYNQPHMKELSDKVLWINTEISRGLTDGYDATDFIKSKMPNYQEILDEYHTLQKATYDPLEMLQYASEEDARIIQDYIDARKFLKETETPEMAAEFKDTLALAKKKYVSYKGTPFPADIQKRIDELNNATPIDFMTTVPTAAEEAGDVVLRSAAFSTEAREMSETTKTLYDLIHNIDNGIQSSLDDINKAYLSLYSEAGLDAVTVNSVDNLRELYQKSSGKVMTSKIWEVTTCSKWMPNFDYTVATKDFLRTRYEVCQSLEHTVESLKREVKYIPDEYIDDMYDAYYNAVATCNSGYYDRLLLDSWKAASATTKEEKLAYCIAAGRQFRDMHFDLGKYDTHYFSKGQLLEIPEGQNYISAHKYLTGDAVTTSGKRYYNPYEIAPGTFGATKNAWKENTRLYNQLNKIDKGNDVLLKKEKLLSGAKNNEYEIRVLEQSKRVYDFLRDLVFTEGVRGSEDVNWQDILIDNYTVSEGKALLGAGNVGKYHPSDMITYMTNTQKAMPTVLKKLTPSQVDEWFWYANDHVVFDKSLGVIETAQMREFLAGLGDSVEVNELDDVITVVYKRTGDTTYSIAKCGLPEINKEVTIPVDGYLNTLDNRFNGQYLFSSRTGNTKSLRRAVYSKYFPDAEIADNGASWFSSYIGSSDNLCKIGPNVSSDPIVNIANGYSRLIRKDISVADQIKVCYANTPHALKVIEDSSRSWEELQREGYQCVQFLRKKDGRIYMDTCLPNAENARVLSFESYKYMQSLCDNYNREFYSELLEADAKKMSIITKAQQLYIQMYLFTNPATWIRNWVDSTTKGVLQEGGSHLSYLKEADSTINGFVAVHKAIKEYQELHNIEDFDNAIRLYYRNNEDAKSLISYRRFKQMQIFERSSLSMGLLKDSEDSSYLCKLFEKNGSMFEKCENLNRTAILLNELDKGESLNHALRTIDISQFDYSKTGTLAKKNKLLPFIDFRLKNYDFWFNPKNWDSNKVSNIAQMYTHNIGGTEYEEQWWSEEAMEYRAWIDTIPKEPYEETPYVYDAWKNYKGSDSLSGFENGWVMLNGNLYLKLGLSFTDALTGAPGFIANITDDGGNILGNVFAPLKTAIEYAFDAISGNLDISGDLSKMTNYTQLASKYGFDITSMIPVVGTLLYRLMQSSRNEAAGIRYNLTPTEYMLLTLCPDLFALPKQAVDYSNRYFNRDIGFDWTDELKGKYRYVTGVSTEYSWTLKDPATYVDTWGRMRTMGFTNEELAEIMSDANGFWVTPEDNQAHNFTLMQGEWATQMLEQNEQFKKDNPWTALPKYQSEKSKEWELKLHTLQVNSQELWQKLKDDLVSYGWTESEADLWLKECAKPTWEISPYKARETYEGRSNGYHSLSGLYGAPTQRERHPNQWRLSDSLGLRRQQTVRGARIERTRSEKLNGVYWHKRQRDIYKDNYAKYGASRMAMNQNLKAYSNRSIVELHRSEQKIRYGQIHRHTKWFA